MDYLEFEQPIAELEAKIEELRRVGSDSELNLSEEISKLQAKCESLTDSIFDKLSPWQVAQLAINQDEAPVQADGTQTAARLYGLSGPCYLPTCHKKLWWVAHSDTPLVVSYPLGRGAVTVVGTPFFFKNGQLARKDNAALAVAIQALYPGADRILFDGYSNGFRDKPDFITLMARGSGRSLLLTVIIALGVLCVWVATAPVLR